MTEKEIRNHALEDVAAYIEEQEREFTDRVGLIWLITRDEIEAIRNDKMEVLCV